MEGNEAKNCNPSGNQEGDKGQGKPVGSTLEKLSKEELVQKCRYLLAIAQKAKTAKDEATAEVKKLKSSLKDSDAVGAEADALREMVADLTEGKIAFTTKIESLQRQLKVSSSEVESLREVETTLLRERNQLVADSNQLAKEKASLQEKFELLEGIWQRERLALEEQVENLEAQNGQVDVLKTKCKKLLEEKTSAEEELQKQQKLGAKIVKLEGEIKLLKEEKKADVIILEQTKSDKNKLEEKLKSLGNQLATLQKEKEQGEVAKLDLVKVRELEEALEASKSSLCNSEARLKEFQETVATLQQEKENQQKNMQEALKNSESIRQELNVCQDEMKSLALEKQELEKKMEDLTSLNEGLSQKSSSEVENTKTKLLEAQKERDEVKTITGQLIEDLKLEHEEKLNQIHCDNASIKEQMDLLQKRLSEKVEMNNALEEQLIGKCNELTNVSEKLEQIEKDRVGNNELFAEKLKEIEKMRLELHSTEEEKVELSKKCETLTTDITAIKEQLENVERQKEDFQNKVSKYETEIGSRSKENEEHKENVEKLMLEIATLNSKNNELSSSIQALEENIVKKDSHIGEVNTLGSSLLEACQKLYPSSSLLLSSNDDSVLVMKSVVDCLNEVVLKHSQCKYEESLEIIIEALEKFQKYCEVEGFSNENAWSKHSECFGKVLKNLTNLSLNLPLTTDSTKEKLVQIERKCSDVASVYGKFCENLKKKHNDDITNLKDLIEGISREKQDIEKESSQTTKEISILKGKLDEMKEGLSVAEKRCVELESQITSGDTEKAEVVKNLQEQILSLKEEKNVLCEKNSEVSTENAHLKDSLEVKKKEIEEMQVKANNILSAKKIIETEKEHLENTVKALKSQGATQEKCLLDEKQDLEKKLTMLSEEKISLEKQFAALTADKRSVEDDAEKEKKALNEKVKALLEEKETLEQEREKQKDENCTLQEKNLQLQKGAEEVDSQVKKLQEKIEAMNQNIEALAKEKDISEKSLKESYNENLQLKSALEASGNRCEELLSELNDMNKVLRERGERISRLEASIKEKTEQLEVTQTQLSELQNKMSTSEAELASKQEQLQTITEKLQSFSSETVATSSNETSCEVRQLSERVKELEQEKLSLNKVIHTLESEVHSLRENSAPCHDGQSEVMSTSTISRAEDSQRMKELEDTFEERYMKLKSVAIRLKKRVAELTAQLNAAEDTRNKLASEKEDLKKKMDGGTPKDTIKATSKNIQIMQGEIDRLQDEVDCKKNELKECGKQLTSAAEQLADVRSQLAQSQEENANLLKTVKTQEENLVSQRDEASSLRGQIAALEKRLAAEVEQQLAIEERRKKAEDQMEEQRQKASQYARELEEAKQDIKNKSLMDLEMRDYELTVEELNNKLADKDTTITELQAEITREKGRSNSLQDQLTHLTSQEATERERAEKMKKLLLDQKTQLAELRQSQEVQLAAQENDRVTIEELTQEVEKQKLVLCEISKEKTKLEDMLRKMKLSSERQIELLEEQLSKYKTEATQLKSELDAIQKEFEGYKVRAASVLRQKARAPEVDVNELKGEKDQLQENYEAAQLRIQQLQSELSALRAEYSFLQSEKEGISRQLSSLTEDVAKKEVMHRERVSSLESKIEAKTTEYQLIIANMSSQNETMSNSFKKQLETVRQTHTQEIEELTNKLEDTEDKLWQLKNTINTSVTPSNGSSSTGLAVAPTLRSEPDQSHLTHNHTYQHRRQPSSHGCEEPRIDVSNMVREEGEGSEWVEPVHRSPSRPGGYSPPPLEQLISSPLPSNVGPPPQEDNISIASINTDTTTKEIARLESKVTSSETRIHQLTSLLHESEAENAKLAQLAEALKEEIRRSSRNENREKHMENMEYMKNIILKFLVMKSGEERKHMVPVLKTVLQLSPQETSDLEHFAVGGDEGNTSQGWGSYLHLWSSR